MFSHSSDADNCDGPNVCGIKCVSKRFHSVFAANFAKC